MTQPIHPGLSASPSPESRAKLKGGIVLFGEVLADVFSDRYVLGGAPFNVARHLKAFGQNPILVTRLGHDALGGEVLEVMKRIGMETLGVQCVNNYPTGRVQVHMKEGGHEFEILPAQAYDFIHPAVVRMTALSVNPRLIYFGTLAQRSETSRRALKALLRSTGAAKFLDINLRVPWYDEKTLRRSLRYADIVKLNDDEVGILASMFEISQNDMEGQVKELINRFGLEQVVVTCGSEGAWQINRNGKKLVAYIENRVTQLVDTVGAGDGFASVCILGNLLRWPVARTLERANTFAAAICRIRGAIPDHTGFYQPFIQQWEV